MYFQNYRVSKTWLENSLKSTISELLLRVNMLKGPHTWKIDMRGILSFFFITLSRNDLEKVFFIEI